MSAPRLASLALSAALLLAFAAAADAQAPKAVPAQKAASAALVPFDGVVEAVRQTVIAAQVSGAVVELAVKVGDRVQAGQLLLRLDARAAEQTASASEAQVQAARAALDIATRDFARQKQLYQDHFISQAALERADAEFRSAQAQANAVLAQAGAARTQSGFYVVRAPFAGVVSEVPVMQGDMALPGRPLLTVYDPAALRITASVPQSLVAALARGNGAQAELPGLTAAGAWIQPTRVQVLPTADASTHTVAVRADLPPRLADVTPGMFARLWLPVDAATAAGARSVTVPLSSVVRRAELTAVYVLNAAGQPLLRQVRLGRTRGDRVEILSGLAPGEPVVEDPQSAARAR